MKILMRIGMVAYVASSLVAGGGQEFVGESEARVVKGLSGLPGEIRKSFDPSVAVTRDNGPAVSKAQDRIQEHLVEALALMKSRKGDVDLDSHRKEIRRYRDCVTDFWRFETRSLAEEQGAMSSSLRLDTFLVRHLAVRLLSELQEFQEESEVSAEKVSAVAREIHREVNAALVWLGPVVDTSIGPQTRLPEPLADGGRPPK